MHFNSMLQTHEWCMVLSSWLQIGQLFTELSSVMYYLYCEENLKIISAAVKAHAYDINTVYVYLVSVLAQLLIDKW